MLFGKFISSIKVNFKPKKKERNIVKDFIDNPELFKLEAFIENDEIKVTIKKKEIC